MHASQRLLWGDIPNLGGGSMQFRSLYADEYAFSGGLVFPYVMTIPRELSCKRNARIVDREVVPTEKRRVVESLAYKFTRELSWQGGTYGYEL